MTTIITTRVYAENGNGRRHIATNHSPARANGIASILTASREAMEAATLKAATEEAADYNATISTKTRIEDAARYYLDDNPPEEKPPAAPATQQEASDRAFYQRLQPLARDLRSEIARWEDADRRHNDAKRAHRRQYEAKPIVIMRKSQLDHWRKLTDAASRVETAARMAATRAKDDARATASAIAQMLPDADATYIFDADDKALYSVQIRGPHARIYKHSRHDYNRGKIIAQLERRS